MHKNKSNKNGRMPKSVMKQIQTVLFFFFVYVASGSVYGQQQIKVEVSPTVKKYINGNLLSEAGFEDGGAAWVPVPGSIIEFTKDKAANGLYSMKITREGGKITQVKSEKFSLTGGKIYTIRYKLFIESTSGGHYNIWIYPKQNRKQFRYSYAGEPIGEWITIEAEWVPAADESDAYILVDIRGDGIYYFDDFYIGEKEARPE